MEISPCHLTSASFLVWPSPRKAAPEIINLYQHQQRFGGARLKKEAEEPQGGELASKGLVSCLHPHLSTSVFPSCLFFIVLGVFIKYILL